MSDSSDRAPTGHQQDIDRVSTVTVSEAAAALGLTPDAVRGRLQRGSLAGDKVKGTWHVHLPTPVEATGHQQATDGLATGDQRGIGGSPTGHHQDALVAHLEGEVAYLRERLEEADRQRGYLQQQVEAERQRADVLQAIGTGNSAPVPPTIAPGSPETGETVPTGLRGWLRRLWGS